MSGRYCIRGAIAALLLASGPTGATRLAAQTGSVTGVVTDAASGQPLYDAHVSLVGTGMQSMTDAQGRYRIDGLPPGTYTASHLHAADRRRLQPDAREPAYPAASPLHRAGRLCGTGSERTPHRDRADQETRPDGARGRRGDDLLRRGRVRVGGGVGQAQRPDPRQPAGQPEPKFRGPPPDQRCRRASPAGLDCSERRSPFRGTTCTGGTTATTRIRARSTTPPRPG